MTDKPFTLEFRNDIDYDEYDFYVEIDDRIREVILQVRFSASWDLFRYFMLINSKIKDYILWVKIFYFCKPKFKIINIAVS